MDWLVHLDWTGVVQAIAVVAALLLAGYQTHRLVVEAQGRDQEKRVERTLDMYRDLVVDGDTARAFHRLSVRLRKEGFAQFARLTWYLPTDQDLAAGGLMDPNADGDDTPFADIYRVMWYFERANLALRHRLVDPSVFFEAAGFHIWWWNEILRNIDQPKAMLAVREIAADTRRWADDAAVLTTWESKCQHDFNGGPAASDRPSA